MNQEQPLGGLRFDELASLFAESLLKKTHAYARSTSLTPYQRSRLADSITIDIRKLGDMAFPAARPFMISVSAQELAESLGGDLRKQTWHSQKKLDNYKSLTYEHFYPVWEIRQALAEAPDVPSAMALLDRMLWIAWITKSEDLRLRQLKYHKVRPGPHAAYREAGIVLLPT